MSKQRAAASLFASVLMGVLTMICGTQVANAATPQQVDVGIYLLDIYDVDLAKCTYAADFYLWFRWRGDVDPREFEIMNGYLESKEHADLKRLPGVTYVSYRCRAVLHGAFDFRNYPWDSQKLVIEIEDASHDTRQLVYAADRANSSTHPELCVGSWTPEPVICYAKDVDYRTNFGEPTRPAGQKATYSRFYFVVPVGHSGAAPLVRLFMPLFVSVAIAFLAFLLRPDDLDPRFGVGIAAVFGAVSSQILVRSSLPDTAQITVGDQIHHLGLGFVFLSLLQSCISLRLWHKDKEGLSRKLDCVSAIAFPLAFATLMALIILPAYR